jgi:carotenoid cleavage dioxygenase-like enzyme
MATTVREHELATGLLSPSPNELFKVHGMLPAELTGVFAQAAVHPRGGARRAIISGVELSGTEARLYRAPDASAVPEFGPTPRLAADLPSDDVTFAMPVREITEPHWHTIASRPSSPDATHLVLAEDGTVPRAEPFELPAGTVVRGLRASERHLLVLAVPLAFRRAAALLGVPDPYSWQQDRPIRIGLLPLRAGGSTRWFGIGAGFISRLVNAFEEDSRVVVDGIRHDRREGPGQLYRSELDLRTGMTRCRKLVGSTDLATVDGRWAARPYRFVFGVDQETAGPVMLSRHDLSTWKSVERPLGIGVRAGVPVFVPRAGESEGDGWLLVLVEDPVHRSGSLLVLDAMDIAGPPVAVVDIPMALPAQSRATWFAR